MPPKPTLIAARPESREYSLEPFEFANVHAQVHRRQVCLTEICAIHNPSDHAMRAWPMILRETGLIERACDHGVGHPDPDSAAWLNSLTAEGQGWGVHGCDGCCGTARVQFED